jgi:hypothetical protein
VRRAGTRACPRRRNRKSRNWNGAACLPPFDAAASDAPAAWRRARGGARPWVSTGQPSQARHRGPRAGNGGDSADREPCSAVPSSAAAGRCAASPQSGAHCRIGPASSAVSDVPAQPFAGPRAACSRWHVSRPRMRRPAIRRPFAECVGPVHGVPTPASGVRRGGRCTTLLEHTAPARARPARQLDTRTSRHHPKRLNAAPPLLLTNRRMSPSGSSPSSGTRMHATFQIRRQWTLPLTSAAARKYPDLSIRPLVLPNQMRAKDIIISPAGLSNGKCQVCIFNSEVGDVDGGAQPAFSPRPGKAIHPPPQPMLSGDERSRGQDRPRSD